MGGSSHIDGSSCWRDGTSKLRLGYSVCVGALAPGEKCGGRAVNAPSEGDIGFYGAAPCSIPMHTAQAPCLQGYQGKHSRMWLQQPAGEDLLSLLFLSFLFPRWRGPQSIEEFIPSSTCCMSFTGTESVQDQCSAE